MAKKVKSPQLIPVFPESVTQMKLRFSKALEHVFKLDQPADGKEYKPEMPGPVNVFDSMGSIRFVVQKISANGAPPVLNFTFGWGPDVKQPPVNLEWFIVECHSLAYELCGKLRPLSCELIGNNFLAINYSIEENNDAHKHTGTGEESVGGKAVTGQADKVQDGKITAQD
jgi:hypothetical protein